MASPPCCSDGWRCSTVRFTQIPVISLCGLVTLESVISRPSVSFEFWIFLKFSFIGLQVLQQRPKCTWSLFRAWPNRLSRAHAVERRISVSSFSFIFIHFHYQVPPRWDSVLLKHPNVHREPHVTDRVTRLAVWWSRDEFQAIESKFFWGRDFDIGRNVRFVDDSRWAAQIFPSPFQEFSHASREPQDQRNRHFGAELQEMTVLKVKYRYLSHVITRYLKVLYSKIAC